MLNHIVIMGRLVKDPELRYTQSQVPVASFTVAVDRDFGGRDGAERQTVSGRLQSRKWQDREGNNRTNWEIQADNVYFGDSKRESDGGYSQNSYGGQSSFSNQSNSYGGYDSAKQNASAPQVAANPYEELEDDGELPF